MGLVASLVSTLVASAASVAAATPADDSFGRLAGGSRYDTAAAISRHVFPDGADAVYLARGLDPLVDALAGGALTDGPVLLVPPCGDIPAAVTDEIDRLNPSTVTALGGDNAVCPELLSTAADGRDAVRLAGGSRYDTAAAISRHVFPDGADAVYLARGLDPLVDALAGGALTDGPVLLVPPCGDIPAAVTDEIDRLNPSTVTALGGDNAVCPDLLTTAADGRDADRLAGGSRYDTAAAISRHVFPDGADAVYLARGLDPLVDALAGGALTDGPVLLVPPCGDIPAAVTDEIDRLNPSTVTALGGDNAVCPDLLTSAATNVSPTTTGTETPASEPGQSTTPTPAASEPLQTTPPAPTNPPTTSPSPAPGETESTGGVNEVDPDVTLTPIDDVIQSATTDDNGTRTLLLDPGTDVDIGDFVTADAGPATPGGLLGRVVRLESTENGPSVTVEQARLSDVVPRADFDLAGELVPTNRRALGPRATTVSCGAGVEAKLEYDLLDFDGDFEMGATWRPFSSNFSGFVSAGVSVGANASVSLEGSASCSFKHEFDGPNLQPIKFAVGPVPVWVTPEIDYQIRGNATLRAGVAASAETSASLSARADLVNGTFSHTITPDLSATAALDVTAEASLRFDIVATLSFQLYGVAGPAISGGPYIDLQADAIDDPWLTIDAGFGGGIEFVLDVLHVHKRATLAYGDLPLKIRLYESEGGFPGPSITTTGLPPGTAGKAYSTTLEATSPSSDDIGWTLVEGRLPPGVELSPDGVVSGTPGREGTFDVVVRATDGVGWQAQRALSLLVEADTTSDPVVDVGFVEPNVDGFSMPTGPGGGLASYTNSQVWAEQVVAWPGVGFVVEGSCEGRPDGPRTQLVRVLGLDGAPLWEISPDGNMAADCLGAKVDPNTGHLVWTATTRSGQGWVIASNTTGATVWARYMTDFGMMDSAVFSSSGPPVVSVPGGGGIGFIGKMTRYAAATGEFLDDVDVSGLKTTSGRVLGQIFDLGDHYVGSQFGSVRWAPIDGSSFSSDPPMEGRVVHGTAGVDGKGVGWSMSMVEIDDGICQRQLHRGVADLSDETVAWTLIDTRDTPIDQACDLGDGDLSGLPDGGVHWSNSNGDYQGWDATGTPTFDRPFPAGAYFATGGFRTVLPDGTTVTAGLTDRRPSCTEDGCQNTLITASDDGTITTNMRVPSTQTHAAAVTDGRMLAIGITYTRPEDPDATRWPYTPTITIHATNTDEPSPSAATPSTDAGFAEPDVGVFSMPSGPGGGLASYTTNDVMRAHRVVAWPGVGFVLDHDCDERADGLVADRIRVFDLDGAPLWDVSPDGAMISDCLGAKVDPNTGHLVWTAITPTGQRWVIASDTTGATVWARDMTDFGISDSAVFSLSGPPVVSIPGSPGRRGSIGGMVRYAAATGEFLDYADGPGLKPTGGGSYGQILDLGDLYVGSEPGSGSAIWAPIDAYSFSSAPPIEHRVHGRTAAADGNGVGWSMQMVEIDDGICQRQLHRGVAVVANETVDWTLVDTRDDPVDQACDLGNDYRLSGLPDGGVHWDDGHGEYQGWDATGTPTFDHPFPAGAYPTTHGFHAVLPGGTTVTARINVPRPSCTNCQDALIMTTDDGTITTNMRVPDTEIYTAAVTDGRMLVIGNTYTRPEDPDATRWPYTPTVTIHSVSER